MLTYPSNMTAPTTDAAISEIIRNDIGYLLLI